MFDLSSQYAIRAVLYLARLDSGTLVQAHVLAKELDLPAPYLSKILQQLVKDGLTVSRKGPSGGFALARRPGEIRVYDIVSSFQNLTREDPRPLGQDDALEPLSAFMREWRDSFVQTLRGLTITQLLEHAKKRRTPRNGSAEDRVDPEATAGAASFVARDSA